MIKAQRLKGTVRSRAKTSDFLCPTHSRPQTPCTKYKTPDVYLFTEASSAETTQWCCVFADGDS